MAIGRVLPALPRDEPTALRTGRRLVRLDASFEAVLGTVLTLSPSTSLHKALGLPAVASAPVVAGFGIPLLPVAFGLWRAARPPGPPRRFVQTLALLNLGTAFAFAAWLLVAHRQYAGPGAAFVGGISLLLAVLAISQLQASKAH